MTLRFLEKVTATQKGKQERDRSQRWGCISSSVLDTLILSRHLGHSRTDAESEDGHGSPSPGSLG